MAGYLEHPYRRRNGLKKKVKKKNPAGYGVAKGELNKEQVAEIFGVTTKTIENWVAAKEALLAKKRRTPEETRQLHDMLPLPLRRSARHVRWKESDIEIYRRRQST